MDQPIEGIGAGYSPLDGSGLLDVLLGLVFIVALIFVLAWLFKKFGSGKLGLGGAIKVIAAMSLGGRDRIALICVGDKHMLLGISPGRISSLHVFDQALDLEPKADAQGEAAPSNQDFASKLQRLMSGTSS